MAKKIALILIFVFIILPIIIIGIIGADVYLTLTSFSPSKVSLNVTTPEVGLASDNSSIWFSMNVTLKTPPAGFIPKTVTARISLNYNGTQLGNSIVLSFSLGKTVTHAINQTFPLDSSIVSSLSQGKPVNFTVKTSATLSIFGITIPYKFKVPDETFSIP